jgi:hypothetical protein
MPFVTGNTKAAKSHWFEQPRGIISDFVFHHGHMTKSPMGVEVDQVVKVFVELPNYPSHMSWLTIDEKTTVVRKLVDALIGGDQLLKLRDGYPWLELLEELE